jgi:PAS domain S-box-containing protein
MGAAAGGSDGLRQVFDAMVDGVLHFDLDGRIVTANRAACRMLGWDPTAREVRNLGLTGRLFNADGTECDLADFPAVRALAGETLSDRPYLFSISTGEMASVLTSASPLIRDGMVEGAIVSFHDVTLLEAANQELREGARFSAALARIGSVVGSTLEVDEVMRAAVRETCDAVGAETAAVVMRHEGAWLTTYSYRFPEEIIGVVLSDEEAPHAAMALHAGAPVAIDDAYNDPRVNRAVMEGYGIRSVLTMPILQQGSVIGVMFMNHHSVPHAFSQQQIDFAAHAATTISLALRNAELFDAQRSVAETLQQAMLTLPERLPGISFSCLYRSATETARVGGDFYGLFQLPGDRIGLAVGDVSGKGLAAAATAAMVKDTVRAYALAGDGPGDIVRKTNNVLHGSLDSSSFVTLVVGVLDLAEMRFTYSSGGHPPVLLVPHDGAPVLLPEGGTVLGPFADARYPEEERDLQAGDTLVLYTDGLTEARSAGALYGDGRLLLAATDAPRDSSPERLAEHLFFDALDFAGGSLSDDLAILVVRVDRPS